MVLEEVSSSSSSSSGAVHQKYGSISLALHTLKGKRNNIYGPLEDISQSLELNTVVKTFLWLSSGGITIIIFSLRIATGIPLELKRVSAAASAIGWHFLNLLNLSFEFPCCESVVRQIAMPFR